MNSLRISSTILRGLTSLALALLPVLTAHAADAPKPLRALLIAGGCCHDYANQKDVLKKGIEARAHVVVDILYSPDKTKNVKFEEYGKGDWARGYDVVIHDECAGDVKDAGYVDSILAPHKAGVPAVNLHCTMHAYRNGPDADKWREFVGIHSIKHDARKPIDVTIVDPGHPIMAGQTNYTTIDEELYNNVKVFPTTHVLMRGKQATPIGEAVVTWTNPYGKTRVFSTTLGHMTETVSDPRYLRMVTRGLLWTCDKLNDTYLKPEPR